MNNKYIHTYIHTHTLFYSASKMAANEQYINTYIHTYKHNFLLCTTMSAQAAYIDTQIHTYTNTSQFLRKKPHTHAYMHTYIHTYIHTYAHTYTVFYFASQFLHKPTKAVVSVADAITAKYIKPANCSVRNMPGPA